MRSHLQLPCGECGSNNTRVEPYDELGHSVYCPHCNSFTLWDDLAPKDTKAIANRWAWWQETNPTLPDAQP